MNEIVTLQSKAGRKGQGVRRGLTLVLGPPNAGKMGLLLDWWHERLDREPVIVAPNLPAAHDLTTEMVARAGVLLGAEPATTFDGLVRLVLGESPRYLSEFERAVIVARMLHSHNFDFLGGGASHPSLAARLGDLLERLAESGHDWQEVEAFLRCWGAGSTRYRGVASDLARLAGIYRQVCETLGVVSRSVAALDAARCIRGWERPVGFYGFTSLTPAQKKLVEALAGQVEVVLVMPHDSGKGIELSPDAEVSFWRARAERVIEVERREPAYSSPAIAYLERHFSAGLKVGVFKPEVVALQNAEDAAQGVRFLLSAGRQAEAEAAAEQVTELLHRGFRPSDIAVVVRRIADWSRLIGQVFDSCHIPYQIDRSVSLGQTAMGRAFLAAARAATAEDPEALLNFLHSPYSGVSSELVDLLELKYRRAGARGFAALLAQAGELKIPGLERVLGLRFSSGQEGASFVDWQAATHLASNMLAAAMSARNDSCKEEHENALVFRTLVRAAEGMLTMSRLGAENLAPLAAEDVLALLGEIPVSLASPALRRETVWVLTAERARARRFAAVLVLGLVEGEFPGAGGTVSLLNKEQQQEMESFGWSVLPPEEGREDALFALAISRAWQVLVLSGRDTDDSGDPCEVSRFWTEAKDLLGVTDEQILRRTLGDQVFAPARAPSLRHFLRALAERGGREMVRAAVEHPNIARVAKRLVGQTPAQMGLWPPEEASPSLRSSAVLAWLANKKDFSPSEIETYLQCPFRWFAQHLLGLTEMQQELDDRAVGELFHSVLSRAYRLMAKKGMLPVDTQRLPQAEQLVTAIVEEIAEEKGWCMSLPSHRLGMARIRLLARLQLALEARLSRQFRLGATEYWLGSGRGVEVDGITMRGRVDRIDVGHDGALFLIDYKSGDVPRESALGTKDGLQLPLYLAALVAESGTTPVVGGAYASPREGKFVGVVRKGWEEGLVDPGMGLKVVEDSEWEALLEQALDISREAAAGIRAGQIHPVGGRTCPPWCLLGAVCRASRGGGQR